MFEKILEKVLIQYFGKFISGLDKNNLKLGVWSGNMIIENVNLKPDIIEMLELPIKLGRSSVGKLTIKIPWKKITSAPVEITIENVFVTLIPLLDWDFDDNIVLIKKVEGLTNYCQKCLKRGIKKKKSDEKDKGYLDKMALKIMDNIQLKIVNIHIRYEAIYNWGITLEMLDVFTTNQIWQRSYIDRTECQNASMNKLFQLKNLAIYWNIKSEDNIVDYNKFMEERILKQNLEAKEYCNFIIVINAEMKVVQNDENTQEALKNMQLYLDEINLIVQQMQFQQFVHFFEQCTKYSKLLWLQRKKQLNKVSETNYYQQSFVILFPKVQQHGLSNLDQTEKDNFNQIIRCVEYNLLLDWVQISARQLIKEAKITKATTDKIKKETAWWKSDKKQAQDIYLDEDEIVAINKQIDQIFQEERKKVMNRPDESIDYKFSLQLNKGKLKIENKGDGLQIFFSGMQCSSETRVDQSYDVIFKLQSLNLDLIIKDDTQPFCYKQNNTSKIEQFLKIHFKKNPKHFEEDASIMIQVEPIECTYNNEIIRKWNNFFDIEGVQENVVQIAAQEKLNKVSNQTAIRFDQVMNSSYRLELFILIASPRIILNNIIFDLGNLSIQSEKDSKYYDYYTLSITNLNLKSNELHILQNLSLQFSLERMKGALNHPEKPRLILSGIIPPVSITLTEKIQKEISTLDKLIYPEKSEEEKLKKLTKEKEQILKNSKYKGELIKKINYLWTKRYTVVSGSFLYCYQKEHDLKWEDRILLKGATLIENYECMILSNNQTWYLKIDENLTKELTNMLDEFKDDEGVQNILVDQSLMQIQLKLSLFDLKLIKENECLYSLKLEDVFYKSHKQTNRFDNTIILGDLEIIDQVYKFDNPDLQFLIRKDPEYKDAFLTIENKVEHNFSQTKLNIGQFILNWKPDTYLSIQQLSKLGTKAFGIDAINLEDEEASLVLQGESSDQIFQHKLDQLQSQQSQRSYNNKFSEIISKIISKKAVEENINQIGQLFTSFSIESVQNIEVKIEQAKINLVHRQSHVLLGYLQACDLTHEVEFTQNSKFMSGNLRELRVFDVTNYPFTLKQYHPFEMVNLGEITYQYANYNKDYFKDQNEITTTFNICSINKVVLEYQHQQLNRFVNYFFIQILQLIFNPSQLIINDGKEKPKLVCGTIEQLFNCFMNPQFMIQEYRMKDVIINLRKQYQDADKLTFMINNVIYSNSHILEPERCNNKEINLPIWVDQELTINNQIISKKNTIQLNVKKLLFENEVKELFGINLKNNYEIKGFMPELEIELTKKEFQLFITILSFNFLTNDMQDQYFIHDYHIYSKFNPIEIRALIYFENLKLKLADSGIEFLFKQTQFETFLTQNQKKIINMYCQKFITNQYNVFLVGSQDAENIKEQSRQDFYQSYEALTETIFKKEERQKFTGCELKIDYIISEDSKELIIDFENNVCFAYSRALFEILNFIDIDENNFPQDNQSFKKSVTMINWKGIITYPNESSNDNLVSRGGINYILEKNKDNTSQKLTISNLEVFLCPENELLEHNFSDVVKRHVVLPMYAYVGLNEKESQQQLDISIENLNIQVSYEDLTPIFATYLFQKKQIESQKPIKQKQQQGEKLLLVNVQIYQADIVLVSFIESPVPLFQFIIKDYQMNVTKRGKYIMNQQTVFQAQFFNLDIGAWEPFIEPLVILSDHSKDQKGNPQNFTSIVVNESSELPMNINFTKENIKQLIELHRRWRQSIKNVEQSIQRKQRSPSRISRNSSIAQSAIEKVVLMSPYIVDNQTGYEIELTIINKTQKKIVTVVVAAYQQFALKYAENMEKRVLSIFIRSPSAIFKEINNLNFSRNKDESRQIEYKIGMLNKQTQILIRIETLDQQKILTISSDILFINNSQSDIELKLINKITQQQFILIVLQNDKKYIPLGYEQSMILVRYSNDGVWSQGMDLQKLILKNGNFNLFINSPCLVLRVIQPALKTQPCVLKFVCPFAIKNLLLLPIDIYFCIEDYCRIEPNQALKISNSQLSKGLKFKIKLPGFQKSQQIEINDQFKTQDFIIRDFLGLELNLQLIPLQDGEGLITIGVDGGLTIQNSLGLNIYFYTQNQQKQLIYQPGQPIFQITDQADDKLREDGCLQIVNLVDNILITFEQCNQEQNPEKISQPIDTKINGQFIVQIPKELGYMDIIIDVQTIIAHNISQKKIINLNPRIVIVNKLKTNLSIFQDRCNQEIFIMPDAKLPYFWRKIQGSKYLKFKLKDLSSGSISAEMQGTLNLPLRNSKGQLMDYLSINCMEEDKIKYIIVQESTQKPLYKMINKLNYDICFYQTDIQELNEYIKTNLPIGGSVDYSLDNPGYSRMITLELYKNGQFSDFVKVELVNSDQTRQYKMADDEIFYLNTQFSLDQRQMIVIISNSEQQSKQYNYDNILNQFSVLIPKLNISIINSHPRDELLAISIQKIEFIQLADILETIQIKIQDLQIDNNQHFRCTYPVLVTQQNEKPNIPFMNVLLKRAHQINFINYFQTIKLAIQPISVRITEGTFCDLESYLKSLEWIEEQKMKQLRIWQKDKSLKQQLCFFDNLQFFPLKLKLSFQKVEKRNNKQYLKSAASQAINCDEVSITIKGYAVTNCFTTWEQLQNKMIQNYKDAIFSNLYKLAGSIDLLGNPIGLIENVQEGFQDLFEMPYDGFVQGPLEGGLGIVKGVGSLTKGVVSGTFNSVSKITGSVASGISQLSMDDDYLYQRQLQNSKKAKTVVHGLGQGMISLVSGVGYGIAGLVTQPYQGAEKDGVGGFFKGVSKGLAGLVIKPVTGALDLVSKTSEGVKNTANFFDEKPNEIRKRLPRIFYGEEQILRNYMLQDSEIMYILDKLIPGLMLIDTFVFMITKYKFAYVVTAKQFILLEILKKQVLIAFNNENLKAFESQQKEYKIYLYNSKITYKERAKVKAFIEQKKECLIIKQSDELIHQFLNQKFNQILQLMYDV
ncbi:unnamed protein product [Paramecium octaurelia]|uniref:Chorein N-terminal domain-containing protein n=1 Tax=Paramecium octaurelia TaxID=43137 RepID=A0A8S1YR76_PAROT|nr:unnamed protein product [Paramecium octaurelia]